MTKEDEYIARLERRADHLAVRVAEARVKGTNYSYDVAELNALLWAIGKLTPSAADRFPYVDKL